MPDRTSSPAQEQWFIFDGRQRQGPYLRSELAARLQAGVVSSDARFSCGGEYIGRKELEHLLREDQDEDLVILEPVEEDGGLPEPDGGPSAGAYSTAAAGAVQTLAGPERAVEVPDACVPTRDRIVVIGRRSSGKTIYLATLYHQLWKSRDGLSMKALSGRAHKELMAVCDTLRRGEWPQATQKDTVHQMEFELEYRGQKRILVGLDYAGEVFRDAFVNDDVSSPQAKALVSHIDRAMAVILLVDPAIAISGDTDAQVDDDYGIVQAIQRIRDWPGGEDVPIVLLLTKADQNRQLFHSRQSTRQFIAHHYPALLRTLKNFKVFHASAVQSIKDSRGGPKPKPDSVQMNILESLRYCLDLLDVQDERKRLEEQQQTEQRAMEQMLAFQAKAEHRSNMRLAIVIGSIITIGICIMVLILVFKT